MDNNLEENNSKPLDGQLLIGEEKSEAIAHKDSALKRLDVSFNKHIEIQEYKKSNTLAYWITDFANYHDAEKTFDPHKLKRYKRGDIIKANLGFNVGGELGGLHYCVVINKTDNLSFDTLNVIPLSSFKPQKKYSDYDLNLGDELHSLLDAKYNLKSSELNEKLSKIFNIESHTEDMTDYYTEMTLSLKYLQKMKFEIAKMKEGSIARIPQITTISKQRIYNPKSKNDILSGIKLSNESMDLIDKKIIEMYTK